MTEVSPKLIRAADGTKSVVGHFALVEPAASAALASVGHIRATSASSSGPVGFLVGLGMVVAALSGVGLMLVVTESWTPPAELSRSILAGDLNVHGCGDVSTSQKAATKFPVAP